MDIKYFAGFLQGTLLTGSWFWWILLGANTQNPIFIIPLLGTIISIVSWGAGIIEHWNK